MRTLAVIPARGGSKGIPRKNLRPIGGKPLIAWAIEAARRSGVVDRVVVSTDSDEIAHVARRFGAETLMRDPKLAEDAVTLDPVVHEAVVRLEQGDAFDLVLTIQPTSPLLQASTVARIVRRLVDEPLDTLLTAVDDTHLAWVERDGRPVPDYAARVNRQSLPRRFRETGGVLATWRRCVTPTGRIGERVGLEIVGALEGVDIDSSDDWLVAEAALGRKRIAFLLIGNRRQGLGHVGRVMSLLESLSAHHCVVFCDPQEDLAIQRLRRAYFPVEVVPRDARLAAIARFAPDVVVHDELETDPEDLLAEKALGARVVTFEDRAGGLLHADAVLNALYPASESDPARNHLFGPQVYILREEFRHAPRPAFRPEVQRVLVTFGGTDPSGLTMRTLDALRGHCDAAITVVAGLGLEPFDALEALVGAMGAEGHDVTLLRDVPMMSELMAQADVAFSSAGRTLYELAHLGVPTVVMAQNDVEMKHTFASIDHGFLFLGRGTDVAPAALRAAWRSLADLATLRAALRGRMLAQDLSAGRARVLDLLLGR